MRIRQIMEAMEELFPRRLCEEWDNCGLLVGNPEEEISRAGVCLDITPAVLKAAIEEEIELLICHHPVIFKPLSRVDSESVVGQLLRAGISVIAAHTNMDIAAGGVNDCLCERLGLRQTEPLGILRREAGKKIVVFAPEEAAEQVRQALADAGAGALGNYRDCSFLSAGTGCFRPVEGSDPYLGQQGRLERVREVRIEAICPSERVADAIRAIQEVHPYEMPAFDVFEDSGVLREYGMGRIGVLDREYSAPELAGMIRELLGGETIRFTDFSKPIRRLAVCGGAGGDLLEEAMAAGADALLTGDVKHSVMIQSLWAGFPIFDGGHFSTEVCVLRPLRRQLRERFPQLPISVLGETEQIFQEA